MRSTRRHGVIHDDYLTYLTNPSLIIFHFWSCLPITNWDLLHKKDVQVDRSLFSIAFVGSVLLLDAWANRGAHTYYRRNSGVEGRSRRKRKDIRNSSLSSRATAETQVTSSRHVEQEHGEESNSNKSSAFDKCCLHSAQQRWKTLWDSLLSQQGYELAKQDGNWY